ncbi:PQQ-dependent sugar dehydrogenase [Aliidiomarina celeris]|uniref:PQQ-dependent sugar dehydrogenase n=1 Tax=Aliidiomarina celeris TaxID=2249428 RepID=UPI000DE98673|nr:PQQ-dependent sugar dehydrogenase [Aliidiomarina celeris]
MLKCYQTGARLCSVSLCAVSLFFCAFLHPVFATEVQKESSPLELNTTLVHESLEFPWALEFLPNGGYLITERTGYVSVFNNQHESVARLQLPLDELWVNGQAGLFEVRAAPNFSTSNQLFFSYACGSERANTTCLASTTFRLDSAGTATFSDFTPIFEARPRRQGSAHYGGRIAFLPDQTLILTLGDGFDYREQAQQTSNHIGSIVRLTLNGAVPSNNPLVAREHSATEIYSYGHRNVQGIAWHEPLQLLLSTEHGPRGGDELNHIESGNNYGWPLLTQGIDYTGARISPHQTLPGMTMPLLNWTPSVAPAGLTVYQGSLFPKEWQGNLLVPTLAAKQLLRINIQNVGGELVVTPPEVLNTGLQQRIRDVRVHPSSGAIYMLTDGNPGALYRITPQQDITNDRHSN